MPRPRTIPRTPPDPENGRRVARWMQAHEARNPRLRLLRDRLVALDGWGVLYNDHEPHLAALLRHGHATGRASRLLPGGRTGACHANCARAWRAAPDRFRIVTGYVLCAEGTWIGHSWLIDRTDTVCETVPVYVTGVYRRYGAVLPPAAARRFCQREL
jgi:hypothetical protein